MCKNFFDFFHKKLAWIYTRAAIRNQLDAVALVEGKEDILFWQSIFDFAGVKVEFIRSFECNCFLKPQGKDNVLKYIPHLNKRFIICVDSDYDYLLQRRPELHVDNFVLQTYTYAIENHYLASLVSAQEFLKEYSRIIYPVLLMHLQTTSSHQRPNIFKEDLLPKNISPEALELVRQTIAIRYPEQEMFTNNYAHCLTPDNAYLWVNVKWLKSRFQCDKTLSFDYFPMNKILDDVAALFPDSRSLAPWCKLRRWALKNYYKIAPPATARYGFWRECPLLHY